jgi:hypothetical protein
MKPRTMRERMLAVIRGEELDRVPFVQYDRIAAPNEDVWDLIGRENMGVLRWCRAHRYEHPNCSFTTDQLREDGREGYRQVLSTPNGTLTQEKWYEPTYHTAATKHHFVKKPEDYRILEAYLDDVQVVEDTTDLERAIRDMGDDGLPLTRVERTPYQQLWVQWVSLQDLCIHLIDIPEVMDRITRKIADIQRRTYEVVYRVSGRIELPYVDIPDNITAPTIGEGYFREYCLPLYQELSSMMADRSVPVIAHTDGDLKPLWAAIGESGIRGLDSFSPPPDNDTRVAEAVQMWPEMRVYVNFPSSVHVGTDKEVYNTASEILEEGGHTGRIWFQISENVPPGVYRTSFPQIVRAIHDFGTP